MRMLFTLQQTESREREHRKGQGKIQLHNSSDLLPPAKPLILKFPPPTITVSAAGDQVVTTETCGETCPIKTTKVTFYRVTF